MTDDGSFYRLLSYLSPSYPIGSFHYSHGIEYAVDCGIVHDPASLEAWITGILEFGSGRNDGIFFKTAVQAVREEDDDLFDRLLTDGSAFRQTPELWMESSEQGEAALKILTQIHPSFYVDQLNAHVQQGRGVPLSILFGVQFGMGTLPLDMGLVGFFHAFVSNLITAGIKLIPLGQSDGQRALIALEPIVYHMANSVLDLPLDELGSAALMVDWTSVSHEHQYTRLFRS